MKKIYNKIILYDDENLMYLTGNLYNAEINQDFITYSCVDGMGKRTIPTLKVFKGTIEGDETETIKLDETLMKRIAKYNKEAEIKKYDKIIEEKKEKIQELDDILIDAYGEVTDDYDDETEYDNFNYKTRNYFKTEEEAQRHLDNINTYYELMNLAEELNHGEEINWGNIYQEKYCIYYDAITKTLCDTIYKRFKAIGQIYCLNENFLEIALERIGKERLEKLFKEE